MLLFPIHTRCAGDADIQQYISRVPARCQGSCAGGMAAVQQGLWEGKPCIRPVWGRIACGCSRGDWARERPRAGAAGGIGRGKMNNGTWKIGNGEAPRGWTCLPFRPPPTKGTHRNHRNFSLFMEDPCAVQIHPLFRCFLKNLPFTQKPDRKLSKLSIRFLRRYSASGVISS